MLLGFSISLAFFNHAKIGISVPLVYPFLLYLLVRMLELGLGKGVPREPLRTIVPIPWLAVAIVFLMAFRIGLNVLNSNVIDVGYAGVIGADKLIHGQPLYGHWPTDNAYGDTYGPVFYFFYVPFRLIFGWSGTWDSLPAAHAAAIFFDVITLGGLFLARPPVEAATRSGSLLAYGWAAYPFTLFTLSSNTNDALVARDGHLRAAGDQLGARPGRVRRARRPDQVRAVRADAVAAARGSATGRPARQIPQFCVAFALVDRDPAWCRCWSNMICTLLARLDRLPIRPRHPVLDLWPVGRPRRLPALAAGRRGGAGDRGGGAARPPRHDARSPRSARPC